MAVAQEQKTLSLTLASLANPVNCCQLALRRDGEERAQAHLTSASPQYRVHARRPSGEKSRMPYVKAEAGVFFRREDYAPFWKRVLVDLLDLLVVGIIFFLFTLPVIILSDELTRPVFNTITAMLAATLVLYFVVLKRSRFRTVGYRLFGVRIVGLDGNPPSYWALIVRLTFGFFGPLNWLLDLIWLSNDPHRQALRDKFANTYVIKASAAPVGTGPTTTKQYMILMFNFSFGEVQTDAASPK
jgi:uncharacterized RDD family membrane protein YckC